MVSEKTPPIQNPIRFYLSVITLIAVSPEYSPMFNVSGNLSLSPKTICPANSVSFKYLPSVSAGTEGVGYGDDA